MPKVPFQMFQYLATKDPHVYEAKVDSTLALKSVILLELIGLLD